MLTDTQVAPNVFPFVTFTSVDGKMFVLPRGRIIHVETYQDKDGTLDENKAFVNFLSPNHKSKGALHAVVDMSAEDFREKVLRPAWQEMLAHPINSD